MTLSVHRAAVVAALSGLVLAGSLSPAAAASAALEQRYAELGRIAADGAFCEKLGYQVAEPDELALGDAFTREILAMGETPSVAELTQAMGAERDSSMGYFKEKAAAITAAKTAKALAAELVDHYAVRCAAHARDSIGRTLYTAPTPPAAAAAREAFMDSMLMHTGEASWQTPAVMATGDMVMAASMCREYVGDDEAVRGIVSKALGGAGPAGAKAQSYYKLMYDGGGESVGELDETQCGRLMTKYKASVAAAGPR